jgi:4'-phosphopantetheinyl transferase
VTGRAPWSGAGVWVLDLADPRWDVAAAAVCLTDGERAHAERGVPAVYRRRVLLRAGLRAVVGRLLGTSPELAPIRTVDGRPSVASTPGSQLGISCSASEEVGLIAAVPGARVGVDVQRHRADEALEAAEEGWLTESEQRALALVPEADRLAAVTRCWTQKEAVLKGRGVGLHVAPRTIDTPVAAGGRSGEWSLSPIPVPSGYIATLAVCSDDPQPEVRVTPLLPEVSDDGRRRLVRV